MKDKEKYTDISTCLVRLSTEFCLLANLVNLRSIHIWPFRREGDEKGTKEIVLQVLRPMANLPFHNLTELGLPIGNTTYLQDLFGNSTHDMAVIQLAQQIQHLHLTGSLDYFEKMIGLNMLFASTNLLSLSIEGAGTNHDPLALDEIKFCQSSPLKFLELTYTTVSSNHLLALLEQCKESIRFLSFSCVLSDSWAMVACTVPDQQKLEVVYVFIDL